MESRKTQLSEGWRKFAAEVGIVVLGVVIALAMGEMVESMNWANRRAEARAALQVELSHAADSATERLRIAGCLERRLSEVARAIDQGAITGRLPSVRRFPLPPMRPWRTTAWGTVVASQTASRFPVATLNKLASAYQTIEQLRSWNIEEKEAWTSLSLLEGSTQPLTPQLSIYLRDAHARAKYYARIIAISAPQLIRDVKQAGIPVEVARRRWNRRNPRPGSVITRVCTQC